MIRCLETRSGSRHSSFRSGGVVPPPPIGCCKQLVRKKRCIYPISFSPGTFRQKHPSPKRGPSARRVRLYGWREEVLEIAVGVKIFLSRLRKAPSLGTGQGHRVTGWHGQFCRLKEEGWHSGSTLSLRKNLKSVSGSAEHRVCLRASKRRGSQTAALYRGGQRGTHRQPQPLSGRLLA